jgi:hypothetical protein
MRPWTLALVRIGAACVCLLVVAGWLPVGQPFGTRQEAFAGHSAWHWAVQWTATANSFYHHGQGSPGVNAYYRWIGVNGRVITPNHLPGMNNPERDHSLGNVTILLPNSSWVQAVWYTGVIGTHLPPCNDGQCIVRSTSMRRYNEWKNQSTGLYGIYDFGSLLPSSGVIYRI